MRVTFRGEDGQEIAVSHTDVIQVSRASENRAWVTWRDWERDGTWASVVEESFVEVLRVLLAAEGVESVPGLGGEIVRLRSRVAELEAGLRAHRDARGHDRCWTDDLTLYALLPGDPHADLRLPPKCEFLAECERYWEHRRMETVTGGSST